MYEKKQGKKSVWYPYIRELDRQRGRGHLDVESPLLWSEAELEYLTGSPTKVLQLVYAWHVMWTSVVDSQCSSSLTWSRPKFLRGLRGLKESTRSLTLSGLWLDLYFRSGLLYLQSKASASCFYMEHTYIKLFVFFFCSNTHLTYQLKLLLLRFLNKRLLPFSPVWCIYK